MVCSWGVSFHQLKDRISCTKTVPSVSNRALPGLTGGGVVRVLQLCALVTLDQVRTAKKATPVIHNSFCFIVFKGPLSRSIFFRPTPQLTTPVISDCGGKSSYPSRVSKIPSEPSRN